MIVSLLLSSKHTYPAYFMMNLHTRFRTAAIDTACCG